jgi:hypothetical protein
LSFAGTPVASVHVTACAGSNPNNEVFYLIESGCGDNFRIDSSSGLISTTNRLDRETTPAYNLTVLAVDRWVKSCQNYSVVDFEWSFRVASSSCRSPGYTWRATLVMKVV